MNLENNDESKNEEMKIAAEDYMRISSQSFEVLTAFFLEDEAEDLLLSVLGMVLDENDPYEMEGEAQIEAFSKLINSVTEMYSGMFIHVVNLVRILAMMGMKSQEEAYQNYISYYNNLLPTYPEVETEDDAIKYVQGLHDFFGWEVEDED
jgi:hypothetical protein